MNNKEICVLGRGPSINFLPFHISADVEDFLLINACDMDDFANKTAQYKDIVRDELLVQRQKINFDDPNRIKFPSISACIPNPGYSLKPLNSTSVACFKKDAIFRLRG